MANESFSNRFRQATQIVFGGKQYKSDIEQTQKIQKELEELREWYESIDPDSIPTSEDLQKRQQVCTEQENAQNLRSQKLTYSIPSLTQAGIKALTQKNTLIEYGLDIDQFLDTQGLRSDMDWRLFGQKIPHSSVTNIEQEQGQEPNTVTPQEPEPKPRVSQEPALPTVNNKFFDRLKQAVSILTNSSSYQSQENDKTQMLNEYYHLQSLKSRTDLDTQLTAREAAIQQKNIFLDEEQAAIVQGLKEIKTIDSAISRATDLSKQDPSTPDFKVHTELIVSKKLQDLQSEIEQAQVAFDSAPENDAAAKQALQENIGELQGKLLATLMAYSETLNHNELVATCQIGDNRVPMYNLLQQMPKIFGYVSPTQTQRATVPDNVRKAATLQYYDVLKELVYADVIQDKHNLQYHNIPDFNLSDRKEGFEALLNKYCGTDYECAKYLQDMFRNFNVRKNPEPEHVSTRSPMFETPLNTPSVTAINQTMNALDEVDDEGR